MNTRRLFLAIPLPDSVKNALEDMQQTLVGIYGKRGLVHRDSLHLTLRFYGDVPDDRIPCLVEELERHFSNLPVIETAVHDLTGFGRPDFPRVVVAGVKPDRAIHMLAGRAEEQARHAGFKAEDRPFRAHITLHRPKQAGYLTSRVLDDPIPFQVDRIELMQSVLRPDRAYYEPIAAIKLGVG